MIRRGDTILALKKAADNIERRKELLRRIQRRIASRKLRAKAAA